jgi:arsenate reductase-like glutaredoxin family protein
MENRSMPITIYCIKNCDTMQRARAWLEKHGVEYAFHDYKTAGIERERLQRWEKKVGATVCARGHPDHRFNSDASTRRGFCVISG